MSCHYLKDHKYYKGTECFGGELVQQVCQTREATLKHPLLLSTTSTLVRYQKSRCVWKKKINVLYLVLDRSFHHLTLFTRHIFDLWRRGGGDFPWREWHAQKCPPSPPGSKNKSMNIGMTKCRTNIFGFSPPGTLHLHHFPLLSEITHIMSWQIAKKKLKYLHLNWKQ